MRTFKMIYLPLVLAGVAVPVAAATTFANALGPNLFAVADEPPRASTTPDTRGSEPQAQVDLPANANTPTAPAMPADPTYQGEPYVGALTAPPADAMNKTYPVCSAAVQDACRNTNGH